jgi:PRTRC genetic system protein E
MSSTLFSLFDRLLLTEESLQFTVSRGPNGTLTVLLQPVLKASTETMSDEVQSIRAALATPLYLSQTPAELDARFDELVRATAAARAELRTNFDALLLTLREANKSAKSQTTIAQKKGAGGTSAALTATAAPAPAKPSAPAPVSESADAAADDDDEASDATTPNAPPSATEASPPSPAAPRGAATQKEPDLFASLNTEASAA